MLHFSTWIGYEGREIPLRKVLAVLILQATYVSCWSIEYGQDDLYVRVVDVGAGECCVIKIPGDTKKPGGYFVVYDAGNWKDSGHSAISAIGEVVPDDAEIDLMVLSHTDADHLGAVEKICDGYKVREIWHSGMKRENPTRTLKNALQAIKDERSQDDCVEVKLSDNNARPDPGHKLTFGNATLTFICGSAEPLKEWGIPKSRKSEWHNAGSIVVRVEYKGCVASRVNPT